MAGLTLDAGVLIAADRNDRRFWATRAEVVSRSVVPVIPALALSQAWRGPRHACLAQVVNASVVDALDDDAAKRDGELQLCAAAKSADVVDAAVVDSAARRGNTIVTTDPKDLRRLANYVSSVEVVRL